MCGAEVSDVACMTVHAFLKSTDVTCRKIQTRARRCYGCQTHKYKTARSRGALTFSYRSSVALAPLGPRSGKENTLGFIVTFHLLKKPGEKCEEKKEDALGSPQPLCFGAEAHLTADFVFSSN